MPPHTINLSERDLELAVKKVAAIIYVGKKKQEALNAGIMSLVDKNGFVFGTQVKFYTKTIYEEGEDMTTSIDGYVYHFDAPELKGLKKYLLTRAQKLVSNWEKEIGSLKELFDGSKIQPTLEEIPELLKNFGIPPFPEAVEGARLALAA